MALNIAVVSQAPDGREIRIENEKIEPTLGDGDSIAVSLKEMVSSITETIGSSIQTESDLTIEISGGISLSTKGGATWLFFNQ